MILIKNAWGVILSYGLLALLVVFIIVDVGSESEIKKVEEINEIQAIPMLELDQIPTKEIHVVQSGENLSVIFEKYKVTTQLIIKISPRYIEKAKRTPKYTAIPFPPLNLNQIGKT